MNLFKFHRSKHFNPTYTFTASILSANEIKKTVASTLCPSCGQLKLELNRAEQGKEGFELEVRCGNCFFNGVANSTGFQFKSVNSKGKARL